MLRDNLRDGSSCSHELAGNRPAFYVFGKAATI